MLQVSAAGIPCPFARLVSAAPNPSLLLHHAGIGCEHMIEGLKVSACHQFQHGAAPRGRRGGTRNFKFLRMRCQAEPRKEEETCSP